MYIVVGRVHDLASGSGGVSSFVFLLFLLFIHLIPEVQIPPLPPLPREVSCM